jgi:hypothetical protein
LLAGRSGRYESKMMGAIDLVSKSTEGFQCGFQKIKIKKGFGLMWLVTLLA